MPRCWEISPSCCSMAPKRVASCASSTSASLAASLEARTAFHGGRATLVGMRVEVISRIRPGMAG